MPLPAYFASLVVGAPAVNGGANDAASLAAIFHTLHPFHGRAYFPSNAMPRAARWVVSADPAHASLAPFGDTVRLCRFGGIEGGGNWTHEHADECNTRVSRDTVVKA